MKCASRCLSALATSCEAVAMPWEAWATALACLPSQNTATAEVAVTSTPSHALKRVPPANISPQAPQSTAHVSPIGQH
ncbi:hypothetical protein G6F59_015023 [Rhizopus arrhizus]|nr:hypothetical protein G6F59_015023 [Rhizopus arrhizus]